MVIASGLMIGLSATTSVRAQESESDARIKALEDKVARLEALLSARAAPEQAARSMQPVQPLVASGAPPQSAPRTEQTLLASQDAGRPSVGARPPTRTPTSQTGVDRGVTASSTGAAGALAAEGFKVGSTVVKIGGYVKLDMDYTRYGGGNPDTTQFVRQFLLPNNIPVGGKASDEATLSARQTRLWITTASTVAGHDIGSRVEVDFQAYPSTADQRNANPATPALRRAYVTVDDWLFGQEWTNFLDPATFPESADYIGPEAAAVLARQPQVRYRHGNLYVSVENPETTLTPFKGGARLVTGDSHVPDVIVRYDAPQRSGGLLSIAGMVRQLRSDTDASDDTALAWGVSLAGKVAVGDRDDLRFEINGGKGIGRYIGSNFVNDGQLDERGRIRPIPVLASFASYRHFWTDTLRSNIMYAFQRDWNYRALTGAAENRFTDDAHVNLVWTPVQSVDVGAEYIRARRKTEGDQTGTVDRVATFARFGF
jgi:hypothetical protein